VPSINISPAGDFCFKRQLEANWLLWTGSFELLCLKQLKKDFPEARGVIRLAFPWGP